MSPHLAGIGYHVHSGYRPSNRHLIRAGAHEGDRKSTRLNSSHLGISYAVFCLKKKTRILQPSRSSAVRFGRLMAYSRFLRASSRAVPLRTGNATQETILVFFIGWALADRLPAPQSWRVPR